MAEQMEGGFYLAGSEISWPIGSAAGMTNHPDVEAVYNRYYDIASAGLAFVPLGSWTLGDERGGNGYVKIEDGSWEHVAVDEYADPILMAGYNAKGLPNPGTDKGFNRLDDFIDTAKRLHSEVALSMSPHSGNPLEELEEIVQLAKVALAKGVLFVEINLSCPNVPDRPPFYLDSESMTRFNHYLAAQGVILNKNGHPGIYLKYGPLSNDDFATNYNIYSSPVVGGRVTSNTLGNQEPKLPYGEPAIEVNGGKAGMSGTALRELGRKQLELFARNRRSFGLKDELISVMGVATGKEVKARLDMDADVVELGSVLYWPEEMRGDNLATPAEVVEAIKKELLDEYEKAT